MVSVERYPISRCFAGAKETMKYRPAVLRELRKP
jgi:hypothetical protein